MSVDEEKTVSASGGVKAGNLQRGSLIPPHVLMEIAKHYGVGALKYEDNNWAKGYEWSKSYDALLRHLTAFWGGEDIDPETGSKHIVAVAWHAIALSHFMDRFPEYDDRNGWSLSEPSEPGPITVHHPLETASDKEKTWSAQSYYGTRLWEWRGDGWYTKIIRADKNSHGKLRDRDFEWNVFFPDYVPQNEGPFTEWTG